jgi:hypothetical protein
MNATTNDEWYYNGEGKTEWGFDVLDDFDEAERAKVKAFVEQWRKDAPVEFVYTEPKDEAPFGEWYRENDEFGGTYVVLLPANPSDAIPADREFPAGLCMWIYVNLGTELPDLTPKWENVDSEVRDVMEAWSQPNPYSTDN